LGPVDVSGQPNFEKTSFGRPILFIFTTLTTQNLCSVSIVKKGATVVTHFWVPAQKIIKYKKKSRKYYQKIIAVRRGCQSALKMVKNWLRRFKITKIKIWQYFVD